MEGFLGVGVGDRILMLSRAIYSVISPEGCASILWRDATFAPDAADALNLTAEALLKLGVIDQIIQEPGEGAHTDYDIAAAEVSKAIIQNLDELSQYTMDNLLNQRFLKYSAMGKFGIES